MEHRIVEKWSLVETTQNVNRIYFLHIKIATKLYLKY
jgi:hypothetical protein